MTKFEPHFLIGDERGFASTWSYEMGDVAENLRLQFSGFLIEEGHPLSAGLFEKWGAEPGNADFPNCSGCCEARVAELKG